SRAGCRRPRRSFLAWQGRILSGKCPTSVRVSVRRRTGSSSGRPGSNAVFQIDRLGVAVFGAFLRSARFFLLMSSRVERRLSCSCHPAVPTVPAATARWVAALWSNFCRGITRRTRTTPAQALGMARRGYRLEEILAWREDWELPKSSDPPGRRASSKGARRPSPDAREGEMDGGRWGPDGEGWPGSPP